MVLSQEVRPNIAESVYSEAGMYEELHPDWHAADGPGKALDIWIGLEDAVKQTIAQGNTAFSFCDIGCGTGAVSAAVASLLKERYPQLQVRAAGFDVAPYAISRGRHLFPDLDLRVQDLMTIDEHFDAVLFCDVFEHLENPFAFLRRAAEVGRFMIVRQPLQGDFGMFRGSAYENVISSLGHIQFFNVRSFTAIAKQAGWVQSRLELVAPWEMNTYKGGRPSLLKRTLASANREVASFLSSGFYLNGSFVRDI
ncbi:class I SAM-dependent methyltransferase [Bradyrhizobium zhanjiangense]|nr:class I SAM-dependent methyltransferase [Bradyrhizobium zhanjiangense]